jgi:DNA-binding CsgD family transcriptional regulator
LVGRGEPVAYIERLLGDIDQQGDALIIRGSPGVGKSSLLAAAEASARSRGYLVLEAVGVEAEARLAFASLHKLLRPVLARVASLPGPQRVAIQTAFGQLDGDPPDLFLIGLATLTLLADTAAERPLLVLADDLRWWDEPSEAVLAFASRRVAADPILILTALRDGYQSQILGSGLREMRLEPLTQDDASRLLDLQAPGLDAKARQLVLAQAAGNPLALVELPQVVGSALDTEALLAGTLPLTERLERVFAARLDDFPADSRMAVLVAAIDDHAELVEILGATARATGRPSTLDLLEPAVAATLIAVDGTGVRFRHPLVRSAVVRAAGPADLVTAHEALAEVTADVDRRAWHRAASTLGTDEVTASDLEAAARRAGSRGATAIAFAGMERAAALTPDPQRRSRRLLAAAELALDLGQRIDVERLVLAAEAIGLDDRDRGRATWLREAFDDSVSWDGPAVHRLIEAAGGAATDGDLDLALQLVNAAGWRCWWADPGGAARDDVLRAVATLPVAHSEPRVLEILGLISPVDSFAQVADGVARLDPWALDDETARIAAFAAHAVGDVASSERLLGRAIDGFRAHGRLGALARCLTVRAWDLIHMGRLPEAERDADEGWRLAMETGQPVWMSGAAIARGLLAGLRGDRGVTDALTIDAEAVLLPLRLSNLLSVNQLARGLAALTSGDGSRAFDHLRRMLDPADVAYDPMEQYDAVGYLAEAAAHAGRVDEAAGLLPGLEALAERTGAPMLHAGLRFARCILAGDVDAERLFPAALAAEPPWPFHGARLRLAFGSWLRRQRRVAESRPHLRTARDVFEGIGAAPWAERARQELRASGERSPDPVSTAHWSLSPQERQIAEMAASGLSNREIGERLFLSHRTVGSHLYRIFPKVGVTSRVELSRALASGDPGPS